MDSETIYLIDNAFNCKSFNHTQLRDNIIFSIKHNEITKNIYDNSTYILQPLNETIEKKVFIYTIHEHLYKNNFLQTNRIILTKDNNISIEINEKNYFCSVFPKGKQFSHDDLQEIKRASNLLAKLHNATVGYTSNEALNIATKNCNNINPDDFPKYIKCDLGNTKELFNHKTSELLRFKKQAMKNKDIFDYEYIAVADYFYSVATECCNALNECEYDNICEKYISSGAICHRDFTPYNLISNNNTDYVTGFENAAIDLPLLDLYNLLKYWLKKNDWKSNEAYEIMNEYSKIRSISSDEIKILKILFNFPQKIWRIVNKYYNSRKSWCEKNCLNKLSEAKKEREKIQTFLDDFR